MLNTAFAAIDTPVGSVKIECSDKGVKQLKFRWNLRSGRIGKNREIRQSVAGNGHRKLANKERRGAAQIAARTKRELEEYFAGRRQTFSVPLDVDGTAFQKRVWKALSAIPYGQVRSYGQIARSIGHPKAYRAVGTANGANPVAIIVPCHRVIASDNTLGGYGGGLTNKSFLLSLEKSSVS